MGDETDKAELRQAAADVAAGTADDDVLDGVRTTLVIPRAGVLGLPVGIEARVPYDDSEVRALLANGILERVGS